MLNFKIFLLAGLLLMSSCGNEKDEEIKVGSFEEAKKFQQENAYHSSENIYFPDKDGNDISIDGYEKKMDNEKKSKNINGKDTAAGVNTINNPEVLLYEDRVLNSTGVIIELYRVGNDLGVNNGALNSHFTLTDDTYINDLTTYHCNNGKGSPAGTISLRGSDGVTHGPWNALGQGGQCGPENVYWRIEPKIVLKKGEYEVLVSDTASWAQNEGTNRMGMFWMNGYVIQ